MKREIVDLGLGYCWRCGGWIDPSLRDRCGREMWDLGHDEHDRSIYRGPEHRGIECPQGGNRATQRPDRKRSSPRRWML